MRQAPVLALLSLAGCPPAGADMTMRLFAPGGGTAAAVRLDAAAAPGPALEMAVFPSVPGAATRLVPLAALPAAPAPAPATAAAVAAAPARDRLPGVRLDLGLGTRLDGLRWGIADYDNQPDTLSELDWRRQKSVVVSARGEAEWPGGWLLAGSVAAGSVVKGTVRDSDYDGNGHTLEWSRTVGDSSDGGTLDLWLAGGRRLRFGHLALTATLGYAWHSQNLRLGKLTQVVSEANSFGFDLPPVGTTFDARSSYDARWQGPRVGLDLELPLPGGWGLGLGAWHEWADYRGSGNWALREEFAHPESFTHLADGRVQGVKAALTRPWGKDGRLGLTWEKTRGRAGPGRDVTHFEGYGDTVTGLNEVVWSSEILRLELLWRF